jgi:hypothetical protein
MTAGLDEQRIVARACLSSVVVFEFFFVAERFTLPAFHKIFLRISAVLYKEGLMAMDALRVRE